jgi:hypothetical protein
MNYSLDERAHVSSHAYGKILDISNLEVGSESMRSKIAFSYRANGLDIGPQMPLQS